MCSRLHKNSLENLSGLRVIFRVIFAIKNFKSDLNFLNFDLNILYF